MFRKTESGHKRIRERDGYLCPLSPLSLSAGSKRASKYVTEQEPGAPEEIETERGEERWKGTERDGERRREPKGGEGRQKRTERDEERHEGSRRET